MSKKRVSYFYDSTSCATAACAAGSASRPKWDVPKLALSGSLQYPPSPCLSRVLRTMALTPPISLSLPPRPTPFPRHLFLEPPPVSTCPPVIPAPLPNRRDWQLPLWAWASDVGASWITACTRRLPCPSSSHPHTRASSNATSVLLRVAAGRLSMHRVFASRYAIGGLFVHGPLRSRASSGRRFLVAGAGVSQGLTRTRMMRSATIGNCYK